MTEGNPSGSINSMEFANELELSDNHNLVDYEIRNETKYKKSKKNKNDTKN